MHYYRFFFKYLRLLLFNKETLGATMEKMADKRKNAPCVLFQNEKISFEELNHLANRRANYFASRGVQKGEVVLLLMENRPEFLASVIGLAKLGAITAAINHNLKGLALTKLLNASTATRIILGSECLEAYNEVAAGLEKIKPEQTYLDTRWETRERALPGCVDLSRAAATASPANPPRAKLNSKDLFMHIYTSGTTGLPKPARINHYRWYGAGLLMGFFALRVTKKDVVYCPLPLYHSNGILIAFGSALVNGATFALNHKFSATNFWKEASDYKATCFVYIGELLRYLVNTPPGPYDRNHQVTRILGNGLRPDIWGKFKYRFNIQHIREFYSSTEGNAYTLNLNDMDGSVGTYPLRTPPNLKLVRINLETEEYVRGADGFGQECPPGEAGELLAEMKNLTPFYGYASQADTEKKIARNLFKKGDAYFKTGDLLKKDAEGNYFFVDRIGDTFRWKGENVSTHEVEEILTAGMPGVAFAVVYGVTIPGTEGRTGMAALTMNPDAQFYPEGFYKFVEDHLPPFARPSFVRVLGVEQMTGTFKKDKKSLKEEGYDPAKVSDKLFYLDKEKKGYLTLDKSVHKHISSGWLKF